MIDTLHQKREQFRLQIHKQSQLTEFQKKRIIAQQHLYNHNSQLDGQPPLNEEMALQYAEFFINCDNQMWEEWSYLHNNILDYFYLTQEQDKIIIFLKYCDCLLVCYQLGYLKMDSVKLLPKIISIMKQSEQISCLCLNILISLLIDSPSLIMYRYEIKKLQYEILEIIKTNKSIEIQDLLIKFIFQVVQFLRNEEQDIKLIFELYINLNLIEDQQINLTMYFLIGKYLFKICILKNQLLSENLQFPKYLVYLQEQIIKRNQQNELFIYYCAKILNYFIQLNTELINDLFQQGIVQCVMELLNKDNTKIVKIGFQILLRFSNELNNNFIEEFLNEKSLFGPTLLDILMNQTKNIQTLEIFESIITYKDTIYTQRLLQNGLCKKLKDILQDQLEKEIIIKALKLLSQFALLNDQNIKQFLDQEHIVEIVENLITKNIDKKVVNQAQNFLHYYEIIDNYQ